MAATTPGQAQAQNADQVHAAATQALAAVTKLSGLLKQVGAPNDAVKAVDDMSNTLNQITSVAVGNAQPAAPDVPTPGDQPDLTSAIQDYHQQAIAQGHA